MARIGGGGGGSMIYVQEHSLYKGKYCIKINLDLHSVVLIFQVKHRSKISSEKLHDVSFKYKKHYTLHCFQKELPYVQPPRLQNVNIPFQITFFLKTMYKTFAL